MFSMESILKLLAPFLGDVETKLAKAMAEEDKEYGTKNIAYLIRRVKSRNEKGEIIDICQMSKIDIDGYTGVEGDATQEWALKGIFVKDKKVTSITLSDGTVIAMPYGKNVSQGIEGIFSSVTKDKE